MSMSIDVAFIRQYESEVHVAYQRMGSKLRSTVRFRGNVRGSSTTFQVYGKGTAGEKTRHGKVPVMNVAHSNVEVVLKDRYAGEWIDDLDMLKTNIDERQLAAEAGAAALGRDDDDKIITALDATPSADVGVHADGLLDRKKCLLIQERFNGASVPDDGNRFVVMPVRQWSAMLQIPEFANADFSGDARPFMAFGDHRFWLGIHWMYHEDLPRKGTNTADCFCYHRRAVAFASGSDIQTTMSWENTESAYFQNSRNSAGSAIIDPVAVFKAAVDDTVALT